jgi:tetratricopeptide (TPR) repeat protein
MRYRIGRTEDSLADLAQARALARTVDDLRAEIDILLDEATALDWTNDYARSSARVTEARALASRPGVFRGLVAARIELGLGRALFRENRHEEALGHLEEAARLSEKLGDDGYETLIIAFILLEVLLPLLGRSEEAEKVAARGLALCEGRGDLLHRSAVINNRRNLLIARKDPASAIADQETFMRIGRELGVLTNEYFAEINLGELRYYSGDLGSAETHARRAMRIETRHPETAPRPVGALLLARVYVIAGRLADARAAVEELRASVARAKKAGRPSAELARSEEVLALAVDLATRDSSSAEWAELRARSASDSIEQEPIEVIELHALSAVRLGRVGEARAAFADALAAARRIPNIVEPRVTAARDRAERAA